MATIAFSINGYVNTYLDEVAVTLAWPSQSLYYAVSYQVLRGGSPIAVTSSTQYTDATVVAGSSYAYQVIAYNSKGKEVAYSDSLSITVPPRMPKPSIAELSQTQTSVTLSIATEAVPGVATGTVFLSRGLYLTPIASHPADGSTWTYVDSGLTTHQTYTYVAYVASADDSHFNSYAVSIKVFVGREYTNVERQQNYLSMLSQPFTKLCRLRFLNPNGTTAFALDNNPRNKRSKAFIADGNVSANLQNGQRLTASVTLANADGQFDFAYNKIWFGQQVALDEGLILPNGAEWWRQTGVFVIDNPTEKIDPATRTVTYSLVDKWADLDGTLGGNLEATYEAPVNSNIFAPIAALLASGRGNGQLVDAVPAVYTEYYNSKTQTLPDGSTVSMVLSPYTLRVEAGSGTIGGVILGLSGMVNAWVGYDNTGRLRIDPSQDDISDAQKAVLYRFSPEEVTLLGLAYTSKKSDVYNDYIVVGEQLDDYTQPAGRAENYDPKSDTNINLIGRKTMWESASGYGTAQQCMDLAEWKLKRSGILQKAVSISCSQMMHIELNSLVEIVRTDKPGNPIERHLIQGYSRPLASSGQMTISAVSVQDFIEATVTEWNGE